MPFDIGIGILLGLWLGPQDSILVNAALGALLVLLPDADMLFFLTFKRLKIKGTERLRDHRELFHYPLIYMFCGIVLLVILWPALIPLFIAASLTQFVHDSVGIGWGIPWLYPFSKKYYKFLYQYDLHHAGQPQKFVWVWSKSEQNKLFDKYGDKDWHKHTFQITQYAFWWHLSEIFVLLIGIAVLFVKLP